MHKKFFLAKILIFCKNKSMNILYWLKIMFGISVFLFSQVIIFPQNFNLNDYNEFLKLNTSYIEADETFLVKQLIIKNSKKAETKTSEYVYCLFHKNGQCVQMKTRNGMQYFFGSSQGYWVFNKKLKTPLKISGAYRIEEFEVQDILKTDFDTDYKITSVENNIFTLERQTQKPPYKFVLFSKTENGFELNFCDTKKNPVRKIVYTAGKVNGVPCFSKIDIYNLLFDKESYSSWITEEIKRVSVPSALFVYTQIQQLSLRMEALLKK